LSFEFLRISFKRILVTVCVILLIGGSVFWLLASVLGSKGLVNVTVDARLYEVAGTCFVYAVWIALRTIIIVALFHLFMRLFK
jgi:hypothetical protein